MSLLPLPIQEHVLSLLSDMAKKNVSMINFSYVGGGCINHGGKLSTTSGNFFLKWNDAKEFPGMFDAEAKGLLLLAKPRCIIIPKVLAHGETGPYQFLLLEFIEGHRKSNQFWKQLGTSLASLHKNTSPHVGLDHHNYIGSLSQFNTTTSSWVDFFIHQRLQVQLKLAVDAKFADTSLIKKFDHLYLKLPSILPDEPASLLHGDLWNGNLITSEHGDPCLIDPAVYYGHREVDLAMTQLFGGFDEDFYDAYHDTYPLLPGLEQRLHLYNLYPLLVHVNLFGRSYLSQVLSSVNKFV